MVSLIVFFRSSSNLLKGTVSMIYLYSSNNLFVPVLFNLQQIEFRYHIKAWNIFVTQNLLCLSCTFVTVFSNFDMRLSLERT